MTRAHDAAALNGNSFMALAATSVALVGNMTGVLCHA